MHVELPRFSDVRLGGGGAAIAAGGAHVRKGHWRYAEP